MRRTGWTGAGRARTAAFSREGLRGGARPHSKIRKGVLKMRLSQNIAGLRHAAGWSQEELAERIDRSPAFVGHVEAPNIKKAVSLDTLFAIAQALDVPAYRFLIFDDSGL